MTTSVKKSLAIKASALLVAAMFTATTLIAAPTSASAHTPESGVSAGCTWLTTYRYPNGVWARVVNWSLHQGVYFNNPPSSYVIQNASGASSWMNGSRLEVGYSAAMLRAGYTPWNIRLASSVYTCYA